MDSDFPASNPQAAAYLAAQSKLVNPYTIPGSAAATGSPLAEPPTHPAHRLHRLVHCITILLSILLIIGMFVME